MRRVHFLLSCFCLPWYALAVSPAPSVPRADAEHIDDNAITAAIDRALMQDEAVTAHNIDVTSRSGIVTLTGHVTNVLAKDRAVQVVETIRGVRAVVDEVRVRPVDRSDADLRNDIKAAFRRDPAADAYEVNVEVDDQVVTLTGTVQSWPEKQLCAEVAKGVTGVTDVTNDIAIRYRTTRADPEIEAEVEGCLAVDPWIDDRLIRVRVDRGQVTLAGSVPSAADKRRARAAAWVANVMGVDAHALEVKWWLQDDMRRENKYEARSDEAIRQAIVDAFLYDPRVHSLNPTVSVDKGMVTLRGTVTDLRAKRAAEDDAANTLGVWRVRNDLKVRPLLLRDDATIGADIRAALAANPYLEQHDITVAVIHGRAQLSGMVDSHYDKLVAANIASGVNGVIALDNGLRVQAAWTWKSDREIMEDLEEELWWSPYVDREEVAIEVDDGVAILSGRVDSWMERAAATDNAFDAGAKAVRNRLSVNGTPLKTEHFFSSYDEFYGVYGPVF